MPDDIQTEFEQIRERITEVMGPEGDNYVAAVLGDTELAIQALCVMFFKAGMISHGREIVDEMERNAREKP